MPGEDAHASDKLRGPMDGGTHDWQRRRAVARQLVSSIRPPTWVWTAFRALGFIRDKEPVQVCSTTTITTLNEDIFHEVAVIIPTADVARAVLTGRIAIRRAGMNARILIVEDLDGWGFAKIVNTAAAHVRSEYVAYMTDDVLPCVDWLWLAHQKLTLAGRDFLPFNDGLSNGRIATSAIVRRSWIDAHCGVLCEKYKTAAWAQAEIGLAASARHRATYEPESTLVSLASAAAEPGSAYADDDDRELFKSRVSNGFEADIHLGEAELEISTNLISPSEPAQSLSNVRHIRTQDLPSLAYSDPNGVAVVMPSIDRARGQSAAQVLAERAGMAATIFVVEDIDRQGFVKTLNAAAERLDVRYVVYLAEDAVPGINWLKLAYEELERKGKALLAFNCGKWHGRCAAFGMVRKEWVQTLYGGPILFPRYRAHRADNELTLIAYAMDQCVYLPEAVLLENDPRKPFRLNTSAQAIISNADKALYEERLESAFGNLIERSRWEAFRTEWRKSSPKHKRG